jgi:hypothetical protein
LNVVPAFPADYFTVGRIVQVRTAFAEGFPAVNSLDISPVELEQTAIATSDVLVVPAGAFTPATRPYPGLFDYIIGK